MALALDDRDIEILKILSREGRIAKSELARRVNLSTSPCWERMKRLERAGLIRGYRAEVDLAPAAGHITVFVVCELESHRSESFQIFERALARYDEVIGCWATGGGVDYLMQVVTRDIDSYQRLIDDMLDARIGLKRYFTYVVTKSVKSSPLPIGVLLSGRKE